MEKGVSRHADSNQHKLRARPTIRMAEIAKSHFTPKSVAERETIGLLHNVYLILINGLPLQVYALVEYQLNIFDSDNDPCHSKDSRLSVTHRSKHST